MRGWEGGLVIVSLTKMDGMMGVVIGDEGERGAALRK